MLRGLISQTVWHGPQIPTTDMSSVLSVSGGEAGYSCTGPVGEQPSIMTGCSMAKRCSLAQWDQWAMWGTVDTIKIKRCYGHSQKDSRQLQLYRNTVVHADWGNRSCWTCSLAFKEISLYKIPRSRLIMRSQSSLYEDSRPSYDVSLIPTFILQRLSFAMLVNRNSNSLIRILPKKSVPLTSSPLMTYIYIYTYIYMSYRTANLQMLHFIYLFNKYTYWMF
jgi:hypothetical protein